MTRRDILFRVLFAILVVGVLAVFSPLVKWGEDMTASVTPAVLNWFVNQERLQNQLVQLTHNDLLAKAARLKAEDMANNGYFEHVSPTGVTPWDWLDLVGYQYDYAGENLALDFVDSHKVKEAWMQSSSHRSNLLKSSYTEIGTGVATGTYDGREVQFVVQIYARPL
ncbi:MAG: hypothetical protein KBD24_00245 [Candidatus Pacebacteria bacterium]|nr:hypothetical protein [Candidatus Paceibacterota bacterium]